MNFILLWFKIILLWGLQCVPSHSYSLASNCFHTKTVQRKDEDECRVSRFADSQIPHLVGWRARVSNLLLCYCLNWWPMFHVCLVSHAIWRSTLCRTPSTLPSLSGKRESHTLDNHNRNSLPHSLWTLFGSKAHVREARLITLEKIESWRWVLRSLVLRLPLHSHTFFITLLKNYLGIFPCSSREETTQMTSWERLTVTFMSQSGFQGEDDWLSLLVHKSFWQLILMALEHEELKTMTLHTHFVSSHEFEDAICKMKMLLSWSGLFESSFLWSTFQPQNVNEEPRSLLPWDTFISTPFSCLEEDDDGALESVMFIFIIERHDGMCGELT